MAYFRNIILGLCVVFLLTSCVSAQFSSVGADACSQIIKAGIYNTIQTSSSQSSYAAFQATMCSDLSTYSYSQYATDSSSLNYNSEAYSINAAASVFGIGGASGGYSTSHTTLTQNQFSQFMSAQQAYRQTSCGSSSSNSGFSNSVNTLSNIIDPTVSTSYVNCLKIYATGIQISQNTGVDSRSLSLDIQFVTNELGATAYMTGLTTHGPATCTLSGPNLPKGATTTFQFEMTVDAVYSIICQLSSSVPSDGGVTDVYISTTPGGTYHALLFHSVPVNQLTYIQSQLTALSKSFAAKQDSVVIMVV